MPTVIAEDDYGQTIQTDDGQVVTVPRGMSDLQSAPIAPVTDGYQPNVPQVDAPGQIPAFDPSQLGQFSAQPEAPQLPDPIAAPPPPNPTVAAPGAVRVDEVQGGQIRNVQRERAQAKQAAFDATGEGQIILGNRQEREAYDTAMGARMEQAGLESQQAEQEAAILADRNEKQAILDANDKEQAELHAKRRAEMDSKLNDAVEEEANWRVDRGHLMRSRTAGQKVGLGIAALLGGLGQVMNRNAKAGPGENQVLNIINKAIDDDVTDQMTNHDAQVKRLGIMGGQIDRFRQLGADEAGQRALLTAALTRGTEMQIEQAAKAIGSPLALARGAEAIAMLQQGRAKAVTEAGNAQFAREEVRRKEEAARRARAAAAAAARRNAIAAGLAAKEKEDRRRLESDRDFGLKVGDQALRGAAQVAAAAGDAGKAAADVRAAASQATTRSVYNPVDAKEMTKPDGSPLGRTPEQAGKVSTMLASTQTAVELSDDIQRLRQKHGAKWFTTSEGTDFMQAKGGLLDLTIKEAYQLGALDKGSQDYLDRITGGDASKITRGDIMGMLGTSGPGAKLEAVAQSLEAKAQNELRAAGYAGSWTAFRKSKDDPKENTDEAALHKIEADQKVMDTGFTAGPGSRVAAAVAQMESGGNVPKSTLQVLNSFAERANGGDEGARMMLEQVSAKGGALGEAADKLLQKHSRTAGAYDQYQQSRAAR